MPRVRIAILNAAPLHGGGFGTCRFPVPAAPEQPPGALDERPVVALDRSEQWLHSCRGRAAAALFVEMLHQRREEFVVLASRDRANGMLLSPRGSVEPVLAWRRIDVG